MTLLFSNQSVFVMIKSKYQLEFYSCFSHVKLIIISIIIIYACYCSRYCSWYFNWFDNVLLMATVDLTCITRDKHSSEGFSPTCGYVHMKVNKHAHVHISIWLHCFIIFSLNRWPAKVLPQCQNYLTASQCTHTNLACLRTQQMINQVCCCQLYIFYFLPLFLGSCRSGWHSPFLQLIKRFQPLHFKHRLCFKAVKSFCFICVSISSIVKQACIFTRDGYNVLEADSSSHILEYSCFGPLSCLHFLELPVKLACLDQLCSFRECLLNQHTTFLY